MHYVKQLHKDKHFSRAGLTLRLGTKKAFHMNKSNPYEYHDGTLGVQARSMLDLGMKYGMSKEALEDDNPRVAEIPFDSGRKVLDSRC